MECPLKKYSKNCVFLLHTQNEFINFGADRHRILKPKAAFSSCLTSALTFQDTIAYINVQVTAEIQNCDFYPRYTNQLNNPSLMRRPLSLVLAMTVLSGPMWQAAAQESEPNLTPYYKELRSNDALDDMTVIDVNDDGKTWTASVVGARYSYHRTNPGDDWLITPGIHLEAGKAYEVTVEIGSYNSRNEEKYEICLGNAATAEAMTTTVVGPTSTTSCYKDEPTPTAKGMVEVAETGTYYVGVHAISEKNRMSLYCLSISVEQGVAPTAPNNLEDVSILAEPTGDYRVDIAFKAPLNDVMGNPMSGNVNVKMLRDEVEVTSWTLSPGESLTYADNLEHRGLYTYRLIPSNDAGDEGRHVLVEKLYVGPYGAAAPTGLTVVETETPGVVHVKWDPVDKDIHGTTLSSEHVTYNIYSKSINGGLETSFRESFPETEKDIKALSDPSKQAFISYCVKAFNRGEGGDPSQFSELTALGAPYSMPMTLSGGKEFIFGSDSRGGVEWIITGNVSGAESQDGDGLVLAGVGSAYNDTGDLHTAKIDLTEAESPLLEFYTYRFESSDRNTITVSVKTPEGTTQVAVADHSAMPVKEWQKCRLSLDAYKGKVIQIILRAKVLGISHTLVDNLSVKEALKSDLMAETATAPESVDPDETFDMIFKVKNDGCQTVSGATLDLYRDGDIVSSRRLTDLPAGESITCIFSDKLTLFDEPETEYSAEITLEGDEDLSNNVFSQFIVTRNVNDFDGVSGLTGEKTSEGNVITWVPIDPDTPQGMKMTEDFEGAESFADTYEGWTLLDIDGGGIGLMIEGVTGYQIPNHPSGEAAGFFIWDTAKSRFAAPCNALSGTKFLASVYNADYSAVEDWAISPLLSGKEQKISFMAQSFDDGDGAHPEQIQIWYATENTDNPDDFIQLEDFGVDGTYSVPCVRAQGNLSAYSRVEAKLPAGAMRFAIVSVTADGWMLMVDDVTFTPDASINPLIFSGYNIYRDGAKLNETLLTEATYTDPVTDNADHTYHVTAVYEPGESELSEPFVIHQSGIDMTAAANGLEVKVAGNQLLINAGNAGFTVIAPDGKVLGQGEGKAELTLPAGIYLINSGTTTRKAIIR